MTSYISDILEPYNALVGGEDGALPEIGDRILDAVQLRQLGYIQIAGVIAASRAELRPLLEREFGRGRSLHSTNELAIDGRVVYGPYVSMLHDELDDQNRPQVFAPNNSIAVWQAPK